MARRYWLMKSDPETFGWDDLLAAPGRRTTWDGIRNYQARNYLRDEVQRGDGVLFYHSGDEKAVRGTCRVTRPGFPDPADAAWTAVEIAIDRPFRHAVTLAEIRAADELQEMALIRNSRLSVQPVTAAEWASVLERGQGR
ncbi:MAG TPA: EVE domain-containing protein [Candidatus Polarisedimenticolaceae bacterium]|nr:EVE domain-containing protein [Candidatus Polarisedimenticolaceae bacterium]